MKQILILFSILVTLLGILIYQLFSSNSQSVLSVQQKYSYWFVLYRKSNVEFLYYGQPGNKNNSQLIKVFKVKSGIPNQRPTPLSNLVGRDYWLITAKEDSSNNPEIAPYFLTLDVPVNEEVFGPVPYLECGGEQCNWEIPGAFGLHGVNGDESRLSDENEGSSGCIRHKDEDIAYLYNLIDLKEQIRYYIEDI